MADFLMPPVNLFGSGTVAETGKRCKLLGGKKALLVTDRGMVDLGIAEKIKQYIESENIETAVFQEVEPNPKDKNVEAGLKVFQDEKCDMLVTLGGGSAHDCGKGIGIMATHLGKISDYAGIETLTDPLPPIISINTTAGTASEVTRHCVITNTDTNVKFVVVSWRNLPSVSINDPELMMSKPAALTAATGMDALTHALETYVSVGTNPVTDAQAIQSMKLIAKWLRSAVYNGSSVEARENMAYASLLAGMAYNNGGLGYVHAMAHQLGGLYDMPHGVANAVLLPHVERFNLCAVPERFAHIAEIFGEDIKGMSKRDAAELAIEAIEQLSSDIGIPAGLSELGVDKKDFATMAEYALKDGNAFTNPIQGSTEDVINIFEEAY